MSIDNVNLLENIVNIPNFDAPVDARCYHAVPISDGQRFQLYDPRKVRIQYFDQIRRLKRPYVQIFPTKETIRVLYFSYQKTKDM